MQLFRQKNYRVEATVTGPDGTTIRTPIVIDTGAGPNLVNYDWLTANWREQARDVDPPALRSANQEPMLVRQVVRLCVQMGDLPVDVWFGIVKGLAVKVLLGTSYIDRFVQSIEPQQQLVVPVRSRPVAINLVPPHERTALLTQFVALLDSLLSPDASPAAPAPVEANQDPCPTRPVPIDTAPMPTKDEYNSRCVRVARQVKIAPFTVAPVLVHCPTAGLVSLETHPHLTRLCHALMAKGVMQVRVGRPFFVQVANFQSTPVHLPKAMIIGLATSDPVVFDSTAPANEVCALDADHTSTTTDQDMPLSDKPKTASDGWEERINIGDAYNSLRDRVLDTLRPFEDMWDGHLGTISAAKHRIEVPVEARPVRGVPYRAGPRMRQVEKEHIEDMLAQKVIEPANSEWASPVVFAPKKDGSLRFCVDYRRLNELTPRDAYPIPRMDECLDSLGDATVFSTLDANSGYWQIQLDETAKDLTSFTSHFGLFRYTRMPFGLKNAPATFQRVMDVILSSVRWQFALVYLDDIFVFSTTVEDHFDHVRTVLGLLKDAGVTLRLDKCHFFSEAVDYLGHVVRPGRLAVSSKTCDAVRCFKPLRSTTDVRSFLGLCNVFRRFVPNFARVSAPLNDKLRKGEPARFAGLTDEETTAFDRLKDLLTSPPILALPRADGHFTLDTDACDRQVGCVLLQAQPDDQMRPVGYWSRTLTAPERNYSTTERECLAVVWAVLLLRPYLDGVRFTVRTDHSALRWILNLNDTTARLTRWRLRLMEFEFEVVHRKGIKHQAADALSRLETSGFRTSYLS